MLTKSFLEMMKVSAFQKKILFIPLGFGSCITVHVILL